MQNYFQLAFKIVYLIFLCATFAISIARMKKGFYGYKYLIVLLFIGIIQAIIEIIFFALRTSGVNIGWETILPIEHFIFSVIIITAVLHFCYYLGWRFAPIVSLTLFTITWSAYAIDLKFNLGYFSFQPVYHPGIGKLWLFLFDLSQLISMACCLVASVVMVIHAWTTNVRRHTLIILAGTLDIFISSVLEFLEHFIPNFDPYGGLTFGIGIFVILLLYLHSPYFVFFSPNKIYKLLLLRSNGDVIFSFSTDTARKKAEEDILAPIIYAFQSFITDLTDGKTVSNIKYILLEKRAVGLYYYKNILGVIISEYYSALYTSALKLFTEQFYERCGDKKIASSDRGDPATIEEANSLLEKIFAFRITKTKR